MFRARSFMQTTLLRVRKPRLKLRIQCSRHQLHGNASDRDATYVYNTMIQAYARSGNLPKMREIYEKMKNNGLTPNLATFGYMLEAFGKYNCVQDMEHFEKEMTKHPFRSKEVEKNHGHSNLIEAIGNADLVAIEVANNQI